MTICDNDELRKKETQTVKNGNSLDFESFTDRKRAIKGGQKRGTKESKEIWQKILEATKEFGDDVYKIRKATGYHHDTVKSYLNKMGIEGKIKVKRVVF